MKQAVPQNLVNQPQRWSLAGLLLLFLLLTACFGGGGATEEAAPEAAVPQTTATLRCNETCLAHGQCGTTADGRTVILARSAGPGFRDHDVLLANDSPVTIMATQTSTIQDIIGVQSSLNFYVVQPAEGGFSSWVAGSCIELGTQP